MRASVGVVHLQRGHHLALRGEGNFADALVAVLACGGPAAAAQLACGHQKGRFGRVALHHPCAGVVLLKLGVACQTTPAQHGKQLAAQRPVGLVCQFGAIAFRPPLGRIAHPGDVDAPRGRHHALDRHLAAGQRAGLVGGDDRGRPQRFHRRQLLDDGLLARHAAHAHGQHHRQDGWQPLGHGGHGQRYAQQQDLHHITRTVDV